jgi:transcriptional regulator with XRE-family HTH domain
VTRGIAGEDEVAFLRALGKRIRLLRLLRELTQGELAEQTGMSRSFVSIIEHGTHGVDVVRLVRIATALGIPLPELVDLRTAPSGEPVSAGSAGEPPERLLS